MNKSEKNGREAFKDGNESEYLDKQKLKDDLIDLPDPEQGSHGQIVGPKHPENEEWHLRENQNQDQQRNEKQV